MKIWEKRALSDAILMSQASARDRPAPTAGPFTAAMVGFSKFWSWRVDERMPPAAGDLATKCRPTWSAVSPSTVRSAPEQNPRPAPVMMSTLTSSSELASSRAFSSSTCMVSPMALSRSGRLSVIVATLSSLS